MSEISEAIRNANIDANTMLNIIMCKNAGFTVKQFEAYNRMNRKIKSDVAKPAGRSLDNVLEKLRKANNGKTTD